MTDTAKVLAHWDAEAEVWVAISHDIKGLAVAAPNEKELIEKLQAVAVDLLMANFGEVPYKEMSIDYIREERVPTAKAA